MSPPERYAVTLGDRGRLVLPASLRRELGIRTGDRLILSVQEDGSVRLMSARQLAAGAKGMFKDLAPGRSLADELIAERRAEQASEDEIG
jgi:AbrB family looped-hinge helix DNA binding protein